MCNYFYLRAYVTSHVLAPLKVYKQNAFNELININCVLAKIIVKYQSILCYFSATVEFLRQCPLSTGRPVEAIFTSN